MAPTIEFSFRHPLYDLEVESVHNDYRKVKPGSKSTEAKEPPGALEKESSEILTEKTSEALSQLRTNARLRQRIPQNEQTHRLCVEADVLDASRLYLLHPVHIALREILKGGKLECRREVETGSVARLDMMWAYVDKNNNRTNFAIIEFKNTFVLHEKEFERAMCSASDAKAALADASKVEGDTATENTLLTGNSVHIMKQVRKYRDENNIADIAVFDWKSMVIIDFDGMDEESETPKLARAIWFTENEKNHRRYQTFRSVLLGFLLRALERNGLLQLRRQA